MYGLFNVSLLALALYRSFWQYGVKSKILKVILNFYIDLTQWRPVTGMGRQLILVAVATLTVAKRLWMIVEIAHLMPNGCIIRVYAWMYWKY
jgi:hypothetical protein